MLAARKSARIDARIKKKLQLQETVARTALNKQRGPKGGTGTKTSRRGSRKKVSDVSAEREQKPAKKTGKAAAKSTARGTGRPIAKAVKASAKVLEKAFTRTTSKALTRTTAKSTGAAPTDGAAGAAESAFRGSNKRTAKRKADGIDSPSPGRAAKRLKTIVTPGTTPRHKQNQKSSNAKKNKSSPIQFDYGVPSPIETERESVDDEDSPNQVLAKAAQRVVSASTKQGQTVRISLDPPQPFTFQSERARQLWENATKQRADHVKGAIEHRDFVPDWMKRQLEGSLEFTASQTRNILAEDKTRRTQGALKCLKLEENALDLNAEIKSSLRKEFANTDLDKCIDCLQKLLQLPVDPLTLKKYPDLAMTPCLLQKYKGALTQWTLTSQEKELFCTKREMVREKAKELQKKYMVLFGIEDDTRYAEIFKQRRETFRKSVTNLTEDEVSSLIHEPSSKRVARKKVPSPPS